MLKIILNRLKPQAEKIIAEEQASFRAGKSTTETDLQHGFAWVADEADHFVVLALLQVAFLGKCDD